MANRHTKPILRGTRRDPSIWTANGRHNHSPSSLSFYQGIPTYKSIDLFSWRLRAHAMDRSSQLEFHTAGKNEVFLPTITDNAGSLYPVSVSTDVAGRGSFLLTGNLPAGRWSASMWVDNSYFAHLEREGFLVPVAWREEEAKQTALPDRRPARTKRSPTLPFRFRHLDDRYEFSFSISSEGGNAIESRIR
jgi:hypothetical protein